MNVGTCRLGHIQGLTKGDNKCNIKEEKRSRVFERERIHGCGI